MTPSDIDRKEAAHTAWQHSDLRDPEQMTPITHAKIGNLARAYEQLLAERCASEEALALVHAEVSVPDGGKDFQILGALRAAEAGLRGDAEYVALRRKAPAIAAAVRRALTDPDELLHDEMIREAAAGELDLPEQEGTRWYVPCGCDQHGDHLGCDESCEPYGCAHPVGVDVSAATEQEADNHIHGPNCWEERHG